MILQGHGPNDFWILLLCASRSIMCRYNIKADIAKNDEPNTDEDYMALRRQSSSPQMLGGEAFPAHQLKRSLQYALCGALIFLFVAPLIISAFRTNDSTSVSARPGFIFLCVVFIVWT